MSEDKKTNWLGVGVGVAATIQWLLLFWRPTEPWAYAPMVFMSGFAIANWFSAANFLRRSATGLVATGAAIGTLPSFGLNFRWKDLGVVEIIPMDGAASVAIAFIAAGLICVALEFSDRVKAMGLTFVALVPVVAFGVAIAARIDRGGNVAEKDSPSKAPNVSVQHSPGTFINSTIGDNVEVNIAGTPPVQMDADDLVRPSYAHTASLLAEFRNRKGWSEEELYDELTPPSSIEAKEVTLGVDNLTANALRITLIDCSSCFEESGSPKTTSSPLEESISIDGEICPTLHSFRANPKLLGTLHSTQVHGEDLAQFCNPSSWFAIFADYPGPDGKPHIVPLGIFKILSGPEQVLVLRSTEDVGNGRTIKAELLE